MGAALSRPYRTSIGESEVSGARAGSALRPGPVKGVRIRLASAYSTTVKGKDWPPLPIWDAVFANVTGSTLLHGKYAQGRFH